MTEVTQILQAVERGEPAVAGKLLPIVYQKLRRSAGEKIAQEPSGQTLQATAMVYEGYRQIVDLNQRPLWVNRRHLFVAEAMPNLTDH